LNIRVQYLIGKPFGIFIGEDQRVDFRLRLLDLTKGNTVRSWETRLFPRDASEARNVILTIAPIRIQEAGQEKVASLRWLLHDITERKRAEVEEREQYFRATFEQAGVGIGHVSSDGRWLQVNQKLCDILGYSREELIRATTPLSVSHPEDVATHQQLHRQLVSGELDTASIEKRYIHKNGSVVWANLTVSAVRSPTGEHDYNIDVIEDITQRKRIEAEERKQRALAETMRETALTLTSTLNFSEVLDHILEGLSRIVPLEAASVLLVEDQGPRIVRGWGYDEGLNPLLEVVLGDVCLPQTENRLFDEIVATKEPALLSEWTDHGKWEQVPAIQSIRSLICAPIIARDDVIGYLALHSSTPNFFTSQHSQHLQTFAAQAAVAIQNARAHEQAQMLAALEERQRLARDLHDAVTQTLFTASVISESLLRLGKDDPDVLMPHLEKLYMLNRGALAEMRNLLVELRPEYLLRLHLSTQLRQLADAVKGRKQIDVQVTIHEGKPIPSEAQVAMYRIAQEALNNVVKHSRASRVEVLLDNRADAVKLVIRDNGRGIKLKKADSGLGMETMRERAASIHASLDIASEAGKGTEVTVIWPRKEGGEYESRGGDTGTAG
jgi:two-component system nitrate/nitrite sensor histidine kinase NarX